MNSSSTRPLAVVTGASSGIGYELAKQFAQHGYDLLVASGGDGIQPAARDFEQWGGEVRAVKTDLATYEGVEKLYTEIQGLGRPVDSIAINAGVGVGGDFATQTDLQAELNMISLNCTSTVHLAKRVVKDLVNQGRGRMLFTASVVSKMPAPFSAVYGATKAFVYSFSQALRNELKDTGITVTALMPGPTETNFFHRAGEEDTKVGQSEKDDPADVARDGFEALMAGKDHIVAGSFMNKAQVTASNVIPDTMTAEMHRKQAEPGSANP